jgi:hypothetical protein
MKNNKKMSVNCSCRIDKEIYKMLSDDAENKGISINALINSMVKRYLMWDRFGEEMGLVPLTKRTLKKIFRTMDDETIKKIAQEVGGTVPQELIYLSSDKFDFENMMKMIEVSNTRFGKVQHNIDNSTHSINVAHGISKKFSLFLAETHQVMSDGLSLRFNVEHMDTNMICMEFEKPEDN